MKRVVLLVVMVLFVLWVGPVLAADEVIIEEIQTEVSETKAKADGNNSRIQALELMDVEHMKLIKANELKHIEKDAKLLEHGNNLSIHGTAIKKNAEELEIEKTRAITKDEEFAVKTVEAEADRVLIKKKIDDDINLEKQLRELKEEEALADRVQIKEEAVKTLQKLELEKIERLQKELLVDDELLKRKLEIMAVDVKASQVVTATKINAEKIAVEKKRVDDHAVELVKIVEKAVLDRGDIAKNKEDIIAAEQKAAKHSTDIKNNKDAIVANTAAIAAEEAARIAADAAEGAARANADGDLQSQITAVGPHLTQSDIEAMGFVTGPHTVDTNTQLSEAEVDAYVGNNGYLAAETDPVWTADKPNYVSLSALNAEETQRIAGDDNLRSDLNSYESRIAALETQLTAALDLIAELQSSVLALDAGGELAELANYVSVMDSTLHGVLGPHVILSGVNLHIQNGAGLTETVNGLGNLIIGYNEEEIISYGGRTGSHNIVSGIGNIYASYGGLVSGYYNWMWEPYNSIVGGRSSVTDAPYGSVFGGYNGLIYSSGDFGTICGGKHNGVNGSYASVSGGERNMASGDFSSISGGYANETQDSHTSISGGYQNIAQGDYSTVSGGTGVNTTVDYQHLP